MHVKSNYFLKGKKKGKWIRSQRLGRNKGRVKEITSENTVAYKNNTLIKERLAASEENQD